MAAREDEAEPLVGEVVVHAVAADPRARAAGLPLQRSLPPDPVDRPVASRGDQPAGGVRRHAVAGPALQRPPHCVPERVLGEVDVAEDADQGGKDAAVLLAEEVRELLYAGTLIGTSGRTSTEPVRAAGIIAAAAIAPSIESASMM